MSASILVGYATLNGSTQEVAGAVAEILRTQGFQVGLQPARKVLVIPDMVKQGELGTIKGVDWHF